VLEPMIEQVASDVSYTYNNVRQDNGGVISSAYTAGMVGIVSPFTGSGDAAQWISGINERGESLTTGQRWGKAGWAVLGFIPGVAIVKKLGKGMVIGAKAVVRGGGVGLKVMSNAAAHGARRMIPASAKMAMKKTIVSMQKQSLRRTIQGAGSRANSIALPSVQGLGDEFLRLGKGGGHLSHGASGKWLPARNAPSWTLWRRANVKTGAMRRANINNAIYKTKIMARIEKTLSNLIKGNKGKGVRLYYANSESELYSVYKKLIIGGRNVTPQIYSGHVVRLLDGMQIILNRIPKPGSSTITIIPSSGVGIHVRIL